MFNIRFSTSSLFSSSDLGLSAMAGKRPTHPDADQFNTAVGIICRRWGAMENAIDITLSVLMQTPSRNITSAITSNCDIRTKLRILMVAGYEHKLSDKWFKQFKELLDTIDNELRPERNRIIHDVWITDDEEILRWQRSTKVVKPQAHKLNIHFGEPLPHPVSQIFDTSDRIGQATFDLVKLVVRTSPWQEEPWLSLGQHLVRQLGEIRQEEPDDDTR